MPGVNAGSMADIAFLLLIFFLVTTSIETDAGLDRRLPRENKDSVVVDYHKRNILPILIGKNGDLMVKEELASLGELRAFVRAFIDNGGILEGNQGHCGYCGGQADPESSDNPLKAVIALNSHRETKYGVYIAVQNELVGAYNELRDREAQRLYQKNFTDMDREYHRPETTAEAKADLRNKIKYIRGLYPLNIVELPQQQKSE